MKIIDLSYYVYDPSWNAAAIAKNESAARGYAACMQDQADVILVRQAAFNSTEQEGHAAVHYFKGKKGFFRIPKKLHQLIRAEKPDAIIVQGFIYPLQTIRLRRILGASVKIFVQHHGEQPFGGIKKWLQKKAARCCNGFLFTATGNAQPWTEAGIIPSADCCFEIPEAGTHFTRIPKENSLMQTGMQGAPSFLWVGRLNHNKDPLTVLKGFALYLRQHPNAALYMIYREESLLPEIKIILEENPLLKKAVILKGSVRHEQLPYWYSAADFYISGSRREGSGYALIEAMACGCLPVLTAIPPFISLTHKGELAFLYPPGNAEALAELLCNLPAIAMEERRRSILQYAKENTSFQAIAERLYVLLNNNN
jgi:glycosyltransferase involved in cell wall biosynthesis